MTEVTATLILGAIAGWIGKAFTGLDTIQIFNFSVLDILIAIAIYDITKWGVFRIIDSQKSDK